MGQRPRSRLSVLRTGMHGLHGADRLRSKAVAPHHDEQWGRGQWGSALALACQFRSLECTVYMVRISYDQKPYRRIMMNTWGAEVWPSPSAHTNAGRGVLASSPDSPGSLGIAISEAVEDAATHADTNYALGSVLNHVMLHQTVIGQEAKLQRSEEHTSELQSLRHLVCRLLLEKKNNTNTVATYF